MSIPTVIYRIMECFFAFHPLFGKYYSETLAYPNRTYKREIAVLCGNWKFEKIFVENKKEIIIMKKGRLLLLALLIASLALLASCSGDDPGAGGSGGNGEASKDAIVGDGVEVTMIYNAAYCDEESLKSVYDILASTTGELPGVGTDATQKAEHEIVIGPTKRDITAAAEKKLAAAIRREARNSSDEDVAYEDLIGYTVYSDGSSVAIVWNSDYLKADAVSYFIDNYLSLDELVISEGYSKTTVMSLTALIDERDSAKVDAAWEALEELFGDDADELIPALKDLYAIFDDELIDWYANLYDPAIGGFYHANSARDTIGFLPDAESTVGVLEMLVVYGMTDTYSDNYKDYLPEWLAEQTVDFIYNLQDPDGYFYLPQWGKDVPNSRRARDLDVSSRFLKAMGVAPKYKYAASYDGKVSLGDRNTVSAVSYMLTATSTYSPIPYQSVEQYTQYIEDGISDAYSLGNFLQSGYPEIVKYSNVLGEDLLAITFDILEREQNKELGVWADAPGWYATNGLHKICSFYNKAGREMPYADKAVETVFASLQAGEEVTQCVQPYNAWSCFEYIKRNIEITSTGTAEEKAARVGEITAAVRSMAADGIFASTKDIIKFKKEDSSFSYFVKFSASQVQGVRGAVPATVEGDVNGTGVAYALLQYILKALDVEDSMVPKVYTEGDRLRFFSILEDLGAVVKHVETVNDPIIFDFQDSESETDYPPEMRYDERNSDFYVATDGATGDKYILIDGRDWYGLEGWETTKRNASMVFDLNLVDERPNVAVFSFDIEFERTNAGRIVDLIFGSVMNESVARLQFVGVKEGSRGYVRIYDSKDADLGLKLPMNTEVNVRIEYYYDEGAIRVYIDDVYLGESKNITTPEATAASSGFAVLGNADVRLKVDNVVSEKTNKVFESGLVSNPPVFEEAAIGKPSYDFEDCEEGENYPDDLLVDKKNGTAVIVDVDGNKKLHVTGTDHYYYDSDTVGKTNWDTKKRNPYLEIFTYPTDKDGNAYVLSYDIKVSSASIQSPAGTGVMRMNFYDALGNVYMTYLIRYSTSGGVTTISYFDSAKTNTELLHFTTGNTVNLRFEYFPELGKTKIYFNDIYVALASNGAEKLPRKVSISVETGANIDLWLDNMSLVRKTLAFGNDSTEPLPELPANPDTPVVPDTPVTPPDVTVYDFETSSGATLPDGVVISRAPANNCLNNGADISVKSTADGKSLSLIGRDRYHDYTKGGTNWNLKGDNPIVGFNAMTLGNEGGFKIEFDMTFVEAISYSSSNNGLVFIHLYDTATEPVLNIPIKIGGTGSTYVEVKKGGSGYAKFNVGEKLHFSLECTNGALNIAVNGTSLGAMPCAASRITSFAIEVAGGFHGEILLDNIEPHNN